MQDISPKQIKRPRKTLIVSLIALVIIILIGTIAALVTNANNTNHPGTSKNPTNGSTSNPSEKPSSNSEIDTSTTATALSVDKYPATNPEAMIRAWYDENSDWENAGESSANSEIVYNDTTGTKGQDILDKTDAQYKSKLVSNDPNPSVQDLEGRIVQSHSDNFNLNFETDPVITGQAGTIGYNTKRVIDSIRIIQADDGRIEAIITSHLHANLDQNDAEKYISGGGVVDTPPVTTQRAWAPEAGNWVIVNDIPG